VCGLGPRRAKTHLCEGCRDRDVRAGADTGDAPGELQYWVERDHLDKIYPLPAGYHAVRMNDQGEMAVLTGQGTAHAASTIMAVGLDARFDFSHAYWLVAGIAGGCPDRVSLGSAFWARWIVDADLGYEIDAREIPSDWSTGYLPLRKARPFEQPVDSQPGQAYALNPELAQWAFKLTRAIPLEDSNQLKEIRSEFEGAAAQRSPFVGMGDEISSSTYWHGKLMTRGPRSGCVTLRAARVCFRRRRWKTQARCSRWCSWPMRGE